MSASMASFKYHWIGGDIRGLAGLADTLDGYIPRLKDLTSTLSSTARGLTSGPGAWQGQAASAFAGTWATHAATAGALEEYIHAVASAIRGLAVELSQIEHALEQAADQAHARGVPVNEQTGVPGGTVEFNGPLPPDQGHLNEYISTRQGLLNEAEYVRGMAAMQLNSLYEKITNYSDHPSQTDGITASSLLGDLGAVPSAARREFRDKLKETTGEKLKLEDEIAEAERAGKSTQKLVDKSDEVKAELRKITAELDKTKKLENALSKMLDQRVRSVHDFLARRSGPGRHVGGNTEKDLRTAAGEDPSTLDKLIKFGENVPVVDVVATLAGIGIGTYEDVSHGQSVGSALLDETISNTVGTVASNAVAGPIVTKLGWKVGGPIGLVAGAVAGYGVGDYVQNFAKDLPADIREHGWAQGFLDAGGDSAVQTVDDAGNAAVGAANAVGHAAVSIGKGAEHYWDDIFG